MRDFETDFEFDFDVGIRVEPCRIDVYPTVIADKTEHSDNDERKARIIAHTERIQREMQELGIVQRSRE